jgi:hypothetical protein
MSRQVNPAAGLALFVVGVLILMALRWVQVSWLTLGLVAAVVVGLRVGLGRRRFPPGSWLLIWGAGLLLLCVLVLFGNQITDSLPAAPDGVDTALYTLAALGALGVVWGVYQGIRVGWWGKWRLDEKALNRLGVYQQCQACHIHAEVKQVTFYKNIGMIFVRRHSHIAGRLCKSCIDQYAADYTLTTLVGGWWGVISFFLMPLILLNNLAQWAGTLGMSRQKLYKYEAPTLNPEQSARIQPHIQTMTDRLDRGEDLGVVAAEVAAAAEVTPAQVALAMVVQARLAALHRSRPPTRTAPIFRL